MNENMPQKHLAAVCGLFCPACTIFIGTHEDPERLRGLSIRMQRSLDEMECHGCRSEKRCFYCSNSCKFVKCAAEKGIDFCGDCGDYPCQDLKTFQAQRPHRIELWESQERIREVGYEEWYAQMIDRYSCPECNTINSAYDLACRNCGATPSCEYVELHINEITRHLQSGK